MNKIKYLALCLGIVLGFSASLLPIAVSAASPCDSMSAAEKAASTFCQHSGDDITTFIASGVTVLLYVLAAVAVVMIILSGIYYTTSGGDPSAVKKAKDTLLYSVVGLVVAILAFAIVQFVVTNIK